MKSLVQAAEDAANSLAKIAHDSGKPVLFDMHKYLDLILGGVQPSSNVESLFKEVKGSMEEHPVDKATSKDLINYLDQSKAQDKLRSGFIEELADLLNNEHELVLAEIGQTDLYAPLGEANVYVIFKLPSNDQLHFLEL